MGVGGNSPFQLCEETMPAVHTAQSRTGRAGQAHYKGVKVLNRPNFQPSQGLTFSKAFSLQSHVHRCQYLDNVVA